MVDEFMISPLSNRDNPATGGVTEQEEPWQGKTQRRKMASPRGRCQIQTGVLPTRQGLTSKYSDQTTATMIPRDAVRGTRNPRDYLSPAVPPKASP